MQTNISYIAKNLFPIALLWLCITECMQETPYNSLIEVSLLCIILPSKQKSGYYVLLLFHPKVSFQCIIMPSKTKESLHYISILYIKKRPCSFPTIYSEGINCENLQGLFWWNGISATLQLHKKNPCLFFIIRTLWINDKERARTLLM